MLDFALRVGFEIRLCQPYRAQTKGKVESGVKYVRRNMWPSLRFTDDADLNRQALEWCDVVSNARVHGTTYRIPWEMLNEERAHLGKLPERATLAPYLREARRRSLCRGQARERVSHGRGPAGAGCRLDERHSDSGTGAAPRLASPWRRMDAAGPARMKAAVRSGGHRQLEQHEHGPGRGRGKLAIPRASPEHAGISAGATCRRG